MFGFDFILSANFMFLRTGTMKIQAHDENERRYCGKESAFELNPKLRDSFGNLWFLNDVIFKLAISSQTLIFQGSKHMSKLSFSRKKG